jgi:type II secretory pathway component PulC
MNKLLDSLDCSNDTFANNLVRWAASIRRSFDEGAIDETITTRRLIHIARAYSIFKDEKKAIQMCINRFDKAVQSAFVTMFETVSKPAETVTPQETKDSTANLNEEIAF